jgi:hypothetical protein
LDAVELRLRWAGVGGAGPAGHHCRAGAVPVVVGVLTLLQLRDQRVVHDAPDAVVVVARAAIRLMDQALVGIGIVPVVDEPVLAIGLGDGLGLTPCARLGESRWLGWDVGSALDRGRAGSVRFGRRGVACMGVTSIASAAPAKTVIRATGPTSLPLNLKFMFILLAHAAVEVGATGRATGPPSERPTAVVADFQVARRRDDGVGVRRLADFVPANPSVGVLVRLPHRLRIADEVGLAQHGHVDVRLACPAAAFARTPDDGRLRALPVLDLQVDLGVREARFDLDRGNLVLHGLAHSADIPGHHSGGFRLSEFRGDVRSG